MLEKKYEFFSYLNKLQKTKRYTGYDKLYSESVSEHTYKMSELRKLPKTYLL